MRVLQIIDLLRIGGAQKLVETFAMHAAQFEMDCTVISLRTDLESPISAALAAAGKEVCYLPANSMFDLPRLRRLIFHLRDRRYDVVQAHLTYANILAAIAGRLTGTPVIATLHSVSEDPRFRNPLRHTLETWALRYGAQAVLAVGEQVAQAHAPRMAKRPITVIPNAAPEVPKIQVEERIAIRARLGCPPGAPVVISVGRLAPPKGYPDLLTAFARLSPEFPAARLWIVGDGVLWKDLHTQIANAGLQDKVTLLGQRNDVPKLLASADIFASASHWEGLPLAILEAMMAGLPVVATAVGDTPAILPPGASLIVPPQSPPQLAEALRTLLRDAPLRYRWGKITRAHAQAYYGVTPWMQRLSTFYRQTISPTS
ncbi:MAG: glycosyltransferase [Anaerolineales bacterium]